jgi:hypothetical protein
MTIIPCPHCHESITLLTAIEVAERLGITTATVTEKARDRGIGIWLDARTRLYTEADADELGRRKGRMPRAAPDTPSPRE